MIKRKEKKKEYKVVETKEKSTIETFLNDGWISESITTQSVSIGTKYNISRGKYLCIFYKYI